VLESTVFSYFVSVIIIFVLQI